MKEIVIDGVTYALVPKGEITPPANESVLIGETKGLYSEHFELTLQTDKVGDDRWFGHSISYRADRYWRDSLEWMTYFLKDDNESVSELSLEQNHELRELLREADKLGWLK